MMAFLMRPSVRSLRDLGYANAARGDGWALVGQDGGQSIDLGDRTLFLFADTLLARTSGAGPLSAPPISATPSRDNAIFLANCAATSPQRGLADALASLQYFSDGGVPRETLRATPAERLAGYRFWPEHGLVLEGQVHFFYIGVRQFDAANTWGFQGVGSGLALFDPATGLCRRLRHRDGWRFWPVLWDDFHMGVQLLREDQTVYVYASRRRGAYSYAMLARVSCADLADPAAYEYLASPRPEWSPRLEDSCELAAAANEYSVSFNAYLKRYLMAYVDGYSKQLCLRAARYPWGPFGEPTVSPVLRHRESSEIISLGFEHPQFAENGGKTVFLSYCQPHFTQNSLVSVTFR